MGKTVPGNLGEFVAQNPERAGRRSAVPTKFGTVYIPPDGSENSYFVVRVLLPQGARTCRFGADEMVRIEFVERDEDWKYTPEGGT